MKKTSYISLAEKLTPKPLKDFFPKERKTKVLSNKILKNLEKKSKAFIKINK